MSLATCWAVAVVSLHRQPSLELWISVVFMNGQAILWGLALAFVVLEYGTPTWEIHCWPSVKGEHVPTCMEARAE